jgi:hypothetical protein
MEQRALYLVLSTIGTFRGAKMKAIRWILAAPLMLVFVVGVGFTFLGIGLVTVVKYCLTLLDDA